MKSRDMTCSDPIANVTGKPPIHERPLLTPDQATEVVALFQALANDSRLRLLHALARAEELCVAHFAAPPARASLADAPRPRLALLAHGGEPLDEAIGGLGSVGTLCLGSEREGLPEDVAAACEARATIALSGPAESLNVAAAAAIGLQRISSLGAAPAATTDPGSG
jgi:DNA-binding transcriptional ArsR family regulator